MGAHAGDGGGLKWQGTGTGKGKNHTLWNSLQSWRAVWRRLLADELAHSYEVALPRYFGDEGQGEG